MGESSFRLIITYDQTIPGRAQLLNEIRVGEQSLTMQDCMAMAYIDLRIQQIVRRIDEP
jgi:hypothetical protein